MDDDGRELIVPDRLASIVRWIVTDVARPFQDMEQTGKLIIHVGRAMSPPKTIVELHRTLS